MEIKTSELQGAALDWAVGEAQGLAVVASFGTLWRTEFAPSIRWAQGGEIIEREKIGVWWATHYVDDEGQEYGNHWYAETAEGFVGDGSTPLIAAMRCYVASKFGDKVNVPEEIQNAFKQNKLEA